MAQTMLPASSVEGGQASFVVEGDAADEHDRVNRAVRLFLLESGHQTVDDGIAIKAEKAGFLGDGVPVRGENARRGGEFVDDAPGAGPHFRGGNELNTLLQQGVNGRRRVESFFRNSRPYPMPSRSTRVCFMFLGIGILVNAAGVLASGTNAARGDDTSQKIGVGGAKIGVGGGKFGVILPKAFEERADVGDVGGGVEVEDNDVVEVGGDARAVFHYVVDDLDEPRGATLLP